MSLNSAHDPKTIMMLLKTAQMSPIHCQTVTKEEEDEEQSLKQMMVMQLHRNYHQ